MLQSLRIRNFRLFDAIDIDRLARVNLVVGKNNAGKTCLLEALRLHGDSASAECIRRVLAGRAEDRTEDLTEPAIGEGNGDAPMLDPIRRLFHGYHLPNDSTAIELGPLHAPTIGATGYSIRLLLAAFESEAREDETIQRRIAIETADEDALIRLLVERKEHDASWTTLRRRSLRRGPLQVPIRDNEPSTTRFVGADTHDFEENMEHWRLVAVRPSARAVVEDALRIIDPEIQEIVVLPLPRRRGGEAVLIYSDTKRLPLRSLGDGIQRLFQIMLAMVASPGGLVLIDEFENGLHWSVQRLAWELLFRLTVELDVQLVATTHSWDCIAAFRDAMAACKSDDALLLHLGRSTRKSSHGAFVSTHYDRESLTHVTQAGLVASGPPKQWNAGRPGPLVHRSIHEPRCAPGARKDDDTRDSDSLVLEPPP